MEKAIASGISASATTVPAITSRRGFENHSWKYLICVISRVKIEKPTGVCWLIGRSKVCHLLASFMKWRRRRDSNPRNPFEVHFFSKEALSATQPLLHTKTEEKISALKEFNLKLKKFNRLGLSLKVIWNKHVEAG